MFSLNHVGTTMHIGGGCIGCVIAPTVFTIYLRAILTYSFLSVTVFRVELNEIDYRLDGRLFDLNRLKAKTKVTKTAFIDRQ